MSDAYAFADQQTVDEILEMLAWWRPRRGGSPESTLPGSRNDHKQPLLVTLLNDLDRGQTVLASVLEPRYSLNQTQVITALGSPSGGYMRWGFRPTLTAATEWSEILYPAVDTADIIEQKLTSSARSLAREDVTVQLGYMQVGLPPDQTNHLTWRWQVTFGGKYSGVDLPLLQIDATIYGSYVIVESVTEWEDTGKIVEVHEVIGVPRPTPCKRGARAWVQWKSRAGWCVVAVEPRDHGDYDLL